MFASEVLTDITLVPQEAPVGASLQTSYNYEHPII
jgi:hypothetical protein